MTYFLVSAGETSSGLTIYAGDNLGVQNGGTVVGTTLSGGEAYIDGTASNTVIVSGGSDDLASDGVSIGTHIGSGGLDNVRGSTSNAVVSAGGEQDVSGTALFTTLSGGTQVVTGVATDTVVSSGGLEFIASGASASATLIGSGGLAIVLSGGTAGMTDVQSGGQLIVLPGASAVGTVTEVGGVVTSTGVVLLPGSNAAPVAAGTLSGATVAGDDQLLVLEGGIAVSASLVYGSATVFSGGITSFTVVSGGTEILSTGGTAFETTVSAYGSQVVSSGGVASGTIVGSAAVLTISSGGVSNDASAGDGGTVTIELGGVASSTTVSGSGNQFLHSGGQSVATILAGNGREIVDSGAYSLSATVSSLGEQDIEEGGRADSATVSGGGTQYVGAGAIAEYGVILGDQVVQLSGQATSTTVSGFQIVYGTANVTNVENGGSQFVSAGAVASATVVKVGGAQQLDGTAVNTVISGGYQNVYASATASLTTINDGGRQYVYGGSVLNTTISSGGLQDVLGGTASNTTVAGFGLEQVESGTVAKGAHIRNGGTLLVLPGGSAIGTIADAGSLVVSSGVLTLSGTTVVSSGDTSYSEQVQGDQVQLVLTSGDANYTHLRGIQTVYAGGIANFTQLDGGQINVSSGGIVSAAYEVADYNYGGIYLGGSITVLAGGATSGTSLIGGGTEFVEGGSAIGTTVGTAGSIVLYSGQVSGTIVQSGGSVTVGSGTSLGDFTLQQGGSVNYTAIAFVSGGSVTLAPTTDILTITEGATTFTQQLDGDYTGEYFHLSQDPAYGGGTTLTVDSIPCYCSGTLILTTRGDVPVEKLMVGDYVITASGQHRPIRWLGRRSFAGRFLAANPGVQPICFQAGSLGNGLPRRDLFVSPEHAMFFDGLLIPARALVNGGTVVRHRAGRVDYHHVELDSHDVLLAEGAPSESFVDEGSRAMFANGREFAALYPDALPHDGFCARRVESGAELQAIQHRMADVAALAGRVAAA